MTYLGLLPLGGRLADLIGRRRVYVLGLLLFAAMSLVYGLAPNGGVRIVARGLQGMGATLTVPAAVSIIATTFAERAERNRALGVFGACASAGFALGLVAGGVVTELLDCTVDLPDQGAAGTRRRPARREGSPPARSPPTARRGQVMWEADPDPSERSVALRIYPRPGTKLVAGWGS